MARGQFSQTMNNFYYLFIFKERQGRTQDASWPRCVWRFLIMAYIFIALFRALTHTPIHLTFLTMVFLILIQMCKQIPRPWRTLVLHVSRLQGGTLPRPNTSHSSVPFSLFPQRRGTDFSDWEFEREKWACKCLCLTVCSESPACWGGALIFFFFSMLGLPWERLVPCKVRPMVWKVKFNMGQQGGRCSKIHFSALFRHFLLHGFQD